jgi:hypothetical protein
MSNNQEHLDEGSMAANSLKPGSNPVKDDPKSKIEYITHTIGAMHAMKKTDLEKWFNDAMNLIGKEASHLPSGANYKSNQNSLNMKPSNTVGGGGSSVHEPMPRISVKEDVEEMFSGQDLSEEFKERATTLFEAAVNARAMVAISQLEEEYMEKLVEQANTINEELVAKVDTYLDYVVEQWMESNSVAVESSLRNELIGEFISGMKNLFAEHYIELPEERVDVVESLAEKVEDLEVQNDALISENHQLKMAFVEVEKETVLEHYLNDMALSQQEKFKALAEGIDFDGNLETYARKLAIIKESYFGIEKRSPYDTRIVEETYEGDFNSATVVTDPSMNKYVQSISRTIKK